MHLFCLSISHHTAPVELREKLWFSDDEIRAALPAVAAQGCAEAVLFSTCNRTELYVVPDTEKADPQKFIDLLNRLKKTRPAMRHEHFAVFHDKDAAEHLFRVASGIDSMILGDVQILMQVKDGFRLAVEAGTAHTVMNRLFQTAFHTGKRVRSETSLGQGAVTIGYASVELAERIFESLHTKSALIIGAGETAQITAKHLRGKNIGSLAITNRTHTRAEALAAELAADVLPFDRFRAALRDVDIVISSVTVDEPILTAGDIEEATRHRHGGALFLVDIGVPRNIDPAAGKLDNVFLYDIDTLRTMVDENLSKRKAQVPKVESIAGGEVSNFFAWASSLEVAPTIKDLTRMAEEIRRSEVEKNINRFDEKDRELLEIVTRRIVNKILHTPISQIRNGHDEPTFERVNSISAIRKLFGLHREHSAEEEHDA